MAALNYATEYSRILSQAYPKSLNFGALYNTENDRRYRWVNAKTIEIPSITTSGRVSANRDTIAMAQRNYDNSWESKTLNFFRKWSTLVHPMDIDETNLAASIGNITEAFNNEQKFPEMDAYTASKIYADWTTSVTEEGYVGKTADSTALTTENILKIIDDLMLAMDNDNVPANGRLLYVTNEVKSLIKNAQGIGRSYSVQEKKPVINREVSRIDEVEVIGVPSTLMKTKYDFTDGCKVAANAQQINMMLVHPSAVITPEKYNFAQLDPPSAGSEGKWIYYEESYGDVFILNKKASGIQFNVSA